MILTNKQEEGLRICVDRYKHHEPYTVISGYAGTGKSELVKFVIAALEIDPEDVCYVAYTGKASEVLREKGNPNAMTAHKLLYYARQKKDGTYSFFPRPALEGCPSLIIIDEASMLPKRMWEQLLKYRVHIIALGDPAQLPPVSKDDDNHILDHPHIFLDEIMRQAKESDIIVASMDVREGKSLRPFKGNDIQIVSPFEVVDGMYDWADEILTATNKTRMGINNYVRARLGFPNEKPVTGDKVICLRNCWDFASEERNDPLVNGSICTLENMALDTFHYRTRTGRLSAPVLIADVRMSSGDLMRDVPIDYQALCTGQKTFSPKQEYAIAHAGKNVDNPPSPVEFNYGYAITTHRAQGSQWDKVLVIEESFPFDKEEHRRWLYTAITRASKKLTLVIK
jgi:exodeoxyribonuclease-5